VRLKAVKNTMNITFVITMSMTIILTITMTMTSYFRPLLV